jgi:hypothetical protein
MRIDVDSAGFEFRNVGIPAVTLDGAIHRRDFVDGLVLNMAMFRVCVLAAAGGEYSCCCCLDLL